MRHALPILASAMMMALPRAGRAQRLTTAIVSDPSFGGMKAITITIPAGWKVQGTIMSSPCNEMPWTVLRAYSPDGMTEMRIMPVFGWRWHPNIRQDGRQRLPAVNRAVNRSPISGQVRGDDSRRRTRCWDR